MVFEWLVQSDTWFCTALDAVLNFMSTISGQNRVGFD